MPDTEKEWIVTIQFHSDPTVRQLGVVANELSSHLSEKKVQLRVKHYRFLSEVYLLV